MARPASRLALTVVALLVALGVHVGPAHASEPLLTRLPSNSPFSPNGDGVKDLGRLEYRLARRASVVTKVTHDGHTLLTRHWDGVHAGAHTFSWDGRSGGRLQPDDSYALEVYARTSRHSAWHGVRATMVLDARYGVTPGGYTSTSSHVLYPRTTVVHDLIGGSVTGLTNGAISRQVLDANGDRVASDQIAGSGTSSVTRGTWSWDGRNFEDEVVAPGHYEIRFMQGRDAAGNPRFLGRMTVSVSDRQLQAETTSVSLAAGQAIDRGQCNTPSGPQGCSEQACHDHASDRFPDGRSYRSVAQQPSGSPCAALDDFVMSVPGRHSPNDVFSIRATGGPTTQGTHDVGTLTAYSDDGVGHRTTTRATMQHDTTSATLADNHFAGLTDPTAPSPEDPYGFGSASAYKGPVLRWSFSVPAHESYDVASFDMTYTRYVLPQ